MPKQKKNIDVARTSIEFNRTLNATAGHFKVVPDSTIEPEDGQTLLHLVFFLTYTREGRQLLRDNRPLRPKGPPLTAAQAGERLRVALRRSFPKLKDDVLDLVIETHLAADAFAALPNTATAAEREPREAAYSQRIMAVLGALHDDAMAHEFSMNW